MSGTYLTLLGVYTDAFTSGWQQALATAAYKFRTTQSTRSVTDALAVVSGYAKQADTLIDEIGAGSVTSKAAGIQMESLSMLLNAKVKGLGPLVLGVEVLDLKILQKAASLDQPALKALAATLKKGADATLLANISSFVEVLTAGVIAAIAASGSASSGVDTKKSMAAVVKKFDLSGQKISPSEVLRNNKLSGASSPYWLNKNSLSTSIHT